MINESIISIPIELAGSLISLITVLKALGWAIVLYVIFNTISLITNRKRNKMIDQLIDDVHDIKIALTKKK